MLRVLSVMMAIILVTGSAAWAEEPIPIGAFLPMTGQVAAFGQMAWEGIQVAHSQEPTVLERHIKLSLVDTKSDKVESANAVSRLIEKDKVVGIIGEMISGNTMAGSDLAERQGIPVVSPTATSPIVTQGRKYIFRVCFIDPDQGRVAARLAVDRLKAKTAVIIYDIAQEYCVALAAFFRREFTKLGGKVLAETKFKTGDTDFTPQLGKIQSERPDIIYAPIYYKECALIAKQAKEMGMNVPILAGDGVQTPELIKIGGDAVENLYLTAHFHKDMIETERGKKFEKQFKETTGKPLDAFSAMGADAYFILVDAIRRAGSADSKKIREALAATKDFEGVTGKISLKNNGDAIKAMVINQVKNGKFNYVTTLKP